MNSYNNSTELTNTVKLTGISFGYGGCAGEVARSRGHGSTLKVAVESIRCMSRKGVREETKPIGLDWSTVCSSGTCVVQSRLKRLACNVEPSNAPQRSGGTEE